MKLLRVGVVGGGGFIGSHVVAAVTAAGGEPVVINDVDAPHLRCEVRVADATNPDEVVKATSGCDSLIHLAARAGGIQMQRERGIYKTNRLITENVLDACNKNGIRDIFLASSQVVYRTSDAPMDEESPILSATDSPSQYAWSKATDEVRGRWWGSENDARVVIGRFGNIYGEGAPYSKDRSTVVHALIERFVLAEPRSNVEVWGDGRAVRSLLYVTDAARAVVTVLMNGEGGEIYNIDSGVPLTIGEIARRINQEVGNDLNLVFDSSKPVGVPYRTGEIGKLRSIGFEPEVPFGAGISATISDYRERFTSKSN